VDTYRSSAIMLPSFHRRQHQRETALTGGLRSKLMSCVVSAKSEKTVPVANRSL